MRATTEASAAGEARAAVVHVRTITDDEGNRLLRIVVEGANRSSRHAQIVLLSAQGMDPTAIAALTALTSADRVLDVIHMIVSGIRGS